MLPAGRSSAHEGRCRAWVLVAAAVVLLTGCAIQHPAVAVIGTQPALGPLVSLVEVELSRGGGMSVVDRRELDRILREQQISLAGLTDREAIIQVGRLVRADGFLFLTLEGEPKAGQSLLRIRMAETAHGVRVLDCYVGWETENAEAVSRDVAGRVQVSARKLNLARTGMIPVGVLDVHRVLLGQQYQWLCRAMVGMLSARLGTEPGLVVLEREDLKRLAEEKVLTEGEEAAFWRSAALVQGRLERGAQDGLQLVVQLKRSSGPTEELGTFPVDEQSPGVGVDGAARAVLAKLGTAARGSWDAKAEAAEFYRQGTLLRDHLRSREAAHLIEAACVLDPDAVQYRQSLLWIAQASWWESWDVPYSREEIAQIASDVVHCLERSTRDWRAQGFQELSEQATVLVSVANASLELKLDLAHCDAELAEVVCRMVRALDALIPAGQPPAKEDFLARVWTIVRMDRYFQRLGRPAEDSVRAVNARSRQLFEEILHRGRYMLGWVQPARTDDIGSLNTALGSCATQAEAAEAVKAFVQRTILPPAMGGTVDSAEHRWDTADAVVTIIPSLYGQALHLPVDGLAFHKEMASYFKGLAASPDPSVRFFACRALRAFKFTGPYPPWAPPPEMGDLTWCAKQMVEEFRDHLQLEQDLSMQRQQRLKWQVLDAMRELTLWQESLPWAYDRLEEFYTPLIESQDVEGLLSWPVPQCLWGDVASFVAKNGSAFGRHTALMRSVLSVLRQHIEEPRVADEVTEIEAYLLRAEDRWRSGLQWNERYAWSCEQKGESQRAKPYRDEAAAIRLALPDLCRHPWEDALTVRMLLREPDWPAAWGPRGLSYSQTSVRLQGRILWAAMISRDPEPPVVKLAGIDLSEGQAVALWQSQCDRTTACGDLEAFVLTRDRCYLVLSSGLLVLPGTDWRGVQWDQEPATPENCPWLGKAHLDGAAAFGDALAVSFHTAENEVGVVLYHPASGMWEPLMSSMDTEWGPLAQGLVTEIGDLASYDGDLLLLASGAGRREIRGIWRMARTSVVPEMMCWLPPGNLSLCGDVIWFRDYGCLARIAPGEGIAEVLLGRDLLYPPAGPERPWRTRESPFIPESGTGALSANSSLSRLMDLRGAALHGDTIWARLGQSQLILLHRGRPLPEGTILDNAILEGRQAVEFLSTSYGLVAIGDGDIGLIGERP